MTTQDGYDWPTPHPVAPQPTPAPGEACKACAGTGWYQGALLRWRCTACDPALNAALQRCQYDAKAHATAYPGY